MGHRSLTWDRHVDLAAEASSIRDGKPWRRDITGHGAGGPDLNFLPGGHIPCDGAHDHHGPGGDLCLDVGVRPDGERVIGQLDAAFHLTKKSEVLGSAQLALDDHRLAEIHDELGSGPAIGWRRLRGLSALRTGRRDSLISFPHVSVLLQSMILSRHTSATHFVHSHPDTDPPG